MKFLKTTIITILAMNGIMKGRMHIGRIILLIISYIFTSFALPRLNFPYFGISYFIATTVIYMFFIYFVLGPNGEKLRKRWIAKMGEERAFLQFETILVILFLHNATSSIFISSSNPGSMMVENNVYATVLLIFSAVLYVFSNTVAVWATAILGVPLYFWKDMFLGKKVSDFVVSGPYKYFKNPMYNIGRLQFYAIAIYYHSWQGFVAAAIGQFLLLLFYQTVEKKFIQRTYLNPEVLGLQVT
jgi:protein-S-isoprenylcysteine O-methyltransferase Ste14